MIFFSWIYICPEKPRILFIILVPVEWITPQREVYFTQVGIIRNVALKEVSEIQSISTFEFTDHSKEVSMSNTVTQIVLRLCDHWLWALRVWRFPRPGDKETAKERTQWILPPPSLVNTPVSWREMGYRKSVKLTKSLLADPAWMLHGWEQAIQPIKSRIPFLMWMIKL